VNSKPYTALYGPDDAPVAPADLECELQLAEAFLAETAGANVHSHADLIKAAVGCHCRLAALVAAMRVEMKGASR
jgi:hypothetical protein